jgi:hypothetical protein
MVFSITTDDALIRLYSVDMHFRIKTVLSRGVCFVFKRIKNN